MQQVCAQGKNMSQYVVADDSWSIVSFDKGTRFPTYGYETTAPGVPLVLQVDTTSPNPNVGAGVILSYTKAQTGFGTAKIT
jgi:hypothetical protein